MKPETLAALKDKVEKWDRVVKSPDELDKGEDSCSLYLVHPDCEGCPVKLKTGKDRCNGTPHDFWKEHQAFKHARLLGSPWLPHREPGCVDCLKIASLMRAYLSDLIPRTLKENL